MSSSLGSKCAMPELNLISSLSSGAASDTGLLRERNEDRYWIDPGRGIFLVVDGVGGQAAGELAAQTAVEAVREALREGMAEAGADALPADARVREAITAANNRIFALAREHP